MRPGGVRLESLCRRRLAASLALGACVAGTPSRGPWVFVAPEPSMALIDVENLEAPEPEHLLTLSVMGGAMSYYFTRYAVRFRDQANAPVAGLVDFKRELAGPLYISAAPNGRSASLMARGSVFDADVKRFLASRSETEMFSARGTLKVEDKSGKAVELVGAIPFRRSASVGGSPTPAPAPTGTPTLSGTTCPPTVGGPINIGAGKFYNHAGNIVIEHVAVDVRSLAPVADVNQKCPPRRATRQVAGRDGPRRHPDHPRLRADLRPRGGPGNAPVVTQAICSDRTRIDYDSGLPALVGLRMVT